MACLFQFSFAFLIATFPMLVKAQQSTQSGYTVCTATINSPEERETFKKHLEGKNFKFVELTDYSQATSKENRGDDWFRNACEAGVQCDILMISGHFGGNFFGDTGFSLGTESMEERSCNKSCDGILKQPKEVFLMGCNTLAGKDPDRRTPAQYLSVLLEDGISRSDAERIVEARYGALGDSYRDRMRRIFSGVPHIYGFDSVGPSGKTVKPFLEKYFKRVPDYENHLLKIEGQRLVSLIETANQAVRNINNSVLEEVLGATHFAQCSGIHEDDPAYSLKKKICDLYRTDISKGDQLKIIHGMLKSPQRDLFVPSIAGFFKKKSIFNEFADKNLVKEISEDPEVRKFIDDLYKKMLSSPALALDILSLKKALGWISAGEFEERAKGLFKDTLKNLTRENVDLLCSVRYDEGVRFKVRLEDFNQAQLRTSLGAAALSCLETEDSRITKEVLKTFDRPDSNYLGGMLYSLWRLPGYNKEQVEIAGRYLNSRDTSTSEIAKSILLNKGDPSTQQKMALDLIKSAQGVWVVHDFLRKNKFHSDELGESILQQLQKPGRERDSFSLAKILVGSLNSQSPVWEKVVQQLGAKDAGVKTSILGEAASLGVKNKNLVEWSIKSLEESVSGNESRHNFYQYLADSDLSQEQLSRLFRLFPNKALESEANLLRGVIKNQKQLKGLTPEQNALLKGQTSIYRCLKTSETRTECGVYDWQPNPKMRN